MWASTYSTSVLSDQCFGTPASATTLLLVGRHVSDQCFDTPTSATTLLLRELPASAMTLMLRGQARL